MEDIVVIPQRIKYRNNIRPSNIITGYISKGIYIILFKRYIHTYLYCSTVYNSKDIEPTQMPTNNRLDKENVVHTHHGIVCSHKNSEIMYFAGTWMKLEAISLSKLTGTEHCMFSLINESWTMRIHGHREVNSTHQVLLGDRGRNLEDECIGAENNQGTHTPM